MKVPKAGDQSIPLRDLITGYDVAIRSQISSIDATLKAFQEHIDTSLDVILMRSLTNLKNVIAAYTRILEKILIVRGILSQDTARRRSIGEVINLIRDNLHFPGGMKVLGASRFLSEMQNLYLSNVEEKIYIQWLRSVRSEYVILDSFIENH